MKETSPYEAKAPGVGQAYTVSVQGNKITFNSKAQFFYCTDTAVRNVVNLLCYNSAKKWGRLIKDDKEETYRKDLEGLVKAIKTGGTVENKSLKDKLKIFYLYQKEVGADAADVVTRSLWNYAICGMDNDFEEGLYQIKYEKDGFELSPGYENNIKLIYNIAKALKLARDEELTEAKEKIDQLSGKASPDQAHEAVEKVYSLLSKDVTVFGNLKFEGDVLIGNLDVRPGNENTFRIERRGYHGNVEFNPIELYQTVFIKANSDSIEKDKLLYLLARCFSTDYISERSNIEAPVLSDFHKLYCRQIREYDAKKHQILMKNTKITIVN